MNLQSRIASIVALIAVILALGAATTRYAQIDEGTRGIVVTQGAVEGVQEPGLFFRLFAPFTKVEIVNVRRQSRQIKQNVASSDKQLYDIDIQVDYSRKTAPEALKAMYGRLGVSDEQLNAQLDGFISEAVKTASTQFTLDQGLSDRGTFSQRIRQYLTTPPGEGQVAPVDQLYITLEAVKVLDINVGEAYSKLLAEKANLEVQIETENKRRQRSDPQKLFRFFEALSDKFAAILGRLHLDAIFRENLADLGHGRLAGAFRGGGEFEGRMVVDETLQPDQACGFEV
jgi:regulator of protease activity HflC (stomatin/prohibitin superfamily)